LKGFKHVGVMAVHVEDEEIWRDEACKNKNFNSALRALVKRSGTFSKLRVPVVGLIDFNCFLFDVHVFKCSEDTVSVKIDIDYEMQIPIQYVVGPAEFRKMVMKTRKDSAIDSWNLFYKVVKDVGAKLGKVFGVDARLSAVRQRVVVVDSIEKMKQMYEENSGNDYPVQCYHPKLCYDLVDSGTAYDFYYYYYRYLIYAYCSMKGGNVYYIGIDGNRIAESDLPDLDTLKQEMLSMEEGWSPRGENIGLGELIDMLSSGEYRISVGDVSIKTG